MDEHAAELSERGFSWVDERFARPEAAFELAGRVIEQVASARGLASLGVVGDFVVPPVGGTTTREFQTLHFDFGLPLNPRVEHELAYFTALHIPACAREVSARTRLVPLAPLLAQRSWPPPRQLADRFVAYGQTHGAWDDSRGYVEGSLARVVEAAAGSVPVLPSVKTETGFLCGLEFDRLTSELTFFERLGLRITDVGVEVPLAPGQLLVFDNLAVAHGRRGTRAPGELHQRAYGYRRVDVEGQRRVLNRVLAAFATGPVVVSRARRSSGRSPAARPARASTGRCPS